MDIQLIFRTWVNALTQPGEEFFAAQRENASATLSTALKWIIAASIIAALLGALRSSIFSSTTGGLDQFVDLLPPEVQDEFGTDVETDASGGPAFSFAYIILGPISFLIGVGIYHLITTILGGRGQYGRYSYLYSTFAAPLMIATSILGFIPVLGGCVSAILGIYQIVLAYYATKVEYNLSQGRAIIVVVAPILAGLLLAICITVVALGAILSILRNFS
ncbi:MAG: YIP1 family protein [Caldilineaceae bacterium SB0675_bin_29]|uniref:YIP1 family protein n=1 Tax=Caldilineaceae bacterium SB0675_bin_29 TaxID=2605266 RepID=A0A6B1G5Q3_9CHLR|nr:YIP1 family protein [Caldilineaceae bacterium SB0675_bin_29]